MPDSGNQLWPRLFCLPTGDRGPKQTSPISRVPHQAAGHTVFMFVDSTLQQLSLWLRSPGLRNMILKARQTNRQGSMISSEDIFSIQLFLLLWGDSNEHQRYYTIMMIDLYHGRFASWRQDHWVVGLLPNGHQYEWDMWPSWVGYYNNSSISLVLSSCIVQKWP